MGRSKAHAIITFRCTKGRIISQSVIVAASLTIRGLAGADSAVVLIPRNYTIDIILDG